MATGTVVEQVAEEIEQVADVTRRIDGRVIGSFWLGVGIGVSVGFYVGYRYSKKKLRAEIYEEAEKEIAEVRELYQQKMVAAEAQDKPPVSEIIAQKGYTYISPEDTEEERPTRPPVPVTPASPVMREIPTPISSKTYTFRTDAAQKEKDEGWDWSVEEEKRSVDTTYILHQNEFELQESGYAQAVLVYYSKDDVLVDEDDQQTILHNRENLIGSEALERFGHGSDDYNIVYIRNDNLEIEYLINRVPRSWEEEVLGLDANDSN